MIGKCTHVQYDRASLTSPRLSMIEACLPSTTLETAERSQDKPQSLGDLPRKENPVAFGTTWWKRAQPPFEGHAEP